MSDRIQELGLLDDEEIELDHAALELSALDHEGADLTAHYQLLDEIEERLRVVGADAGTLEEQADALRQVLAEEFGFIGDADGYDAPVNADLIRVLERRQGIPVSLSILYVGVARRLGWTAYALATPGHVLVRLGSDRFMVLDPFAGGGTVSQDQLAGMVRHFVGPEATVRPEYLAPVANRAVLARLLSNQAIRAEQGGDLDRATTLRRRMTTVAPGFSELWWELARLQIRGQDREGARESLSAMLEVTREPELRRQVTETLAALAEPGGEPD